MTAEEVPHRPRMNGCAVIIITYNRRDWLQEAFDSVRRQSHPPDRIIVVDGPSTDSTREYLSQEAKADPRLVLVFESGLAGVAAARNSGLRKVAEDVVLFLDDDATAEPGWVKAMVQAFEDPGVGIVAGPVYEEESQRLEQGHGWVNRLARTVFSEQPGEASAQATRSRFPYAKGCNMGFRRNALAEVGGFDPVYRYGHDETDIAVRVQQAGYLFRFAPEARIRHGKALGHNRLAKTAYNWPKIAHSSTYFATKNFGLLWGGLAFGTHAVGIWRNQVRAWRRGDLPAHPALKAMLVVPKNLYQGLRDGFRARTARRR